MIRIAARVLGVITVVWIAYTLVAIGRLAPVVLADPEAIARVMSVRDDDVILSAAALAYRGLAGGFPLVIEFAPALGASIAAMPHQRPVRVGGSAIPLCRTAPWLVNGPWLRANGWNRPTEVAIRLVATVVATMRIVLRAVASRRKTVTAARA